MTEVNFHSMAVTLERCERLVRCVRELLGGVDMEVEFLDGLELECRVNKEAALEAKNEG